MEEVRNNSSLGVRYRRQKGGYLGSTERQKKSTLPHGWTSVISQKMRRWNCSKVTVWKTTLEPCSIYWTRIWCVTNDDRKSNGCHCKTTSRISIHSGSGGCSQIVQNSKVRMSRYLDTSTEEQMAIMVQYGRFGGSSWMKFVQKPLAGLWERQFEEDHWENWNLDGKNYRVGNVYLLTENNDYFHWYTQMTSKSLEKHDVTSIWKKKWKMLILAKQLHVIFFGDALNANPAAVRTQRECAPNAYREIKCSKSRFSVEAIEKLIFNVRKKLHAWKDVLKNAYIDNANWRTPLKTPQTPQKLEPFFRTLPECVDTCRQPFTKWQDRRCQCAVQHGHKIPCTVFGIVLKVLWCPMFHFFSGTMWKWVFTSCLRGVNVRSVEAVSHYFVFRRVFVAWRASLEARCLCFGHRLLRRCACRVSRLCYWHDVRPNLWAKKKCATVVFRTFFFSVCQECGRFMSTIFSQSDIMNISKAMFGTNTSLVACKSSCSRPCPVFETLLEVHFSEFARSRGDDFIVSSRDGDQSHFTYFEATQFLDIAMSKVLVTELSHPSKQKVLVFQISISSILCSVVFQFLIKVVLRFFFFFKKKSGRSWRCVWAVRNFLTLGGVPYSVNRKTEQLHRVENQVFAWMSIISRKRNLSQLKNCEKLLTNGLEIFIPARIARLDILWFANKLARAVTNGHELLTDVDPVWFLITQVTTDNIVMWVTRLRVVDWVWIRCCWRFFDSKSTSGGILCILLDVQETYFSVLQFYRIRNHFVGY